jgi:hypothetical protein
MQTASPAFIGLGGAFLLGGRKVLGGTRRAVRLAHGEPFGIAHGRQARRLHGGRWFISGDQAEAGGFADPGGDAGVALLGGFEMLEILPQGGVVKLGEKVGRDGRIVFADVVDQLTFVHGGNTFKTGR